MKTLAATHTLKSSVNSNHILPALLAASCLPDPRQHGTWTKDGVSLATLCTQSEIESQSQTTYPGAGTIIFDGRIDNRQNLIAELGREAALQFNDLDEDLSDEELVLICYLYWGREAFAKLLGDFALVIWDERERKLIAARDKVGVKPFYYRFDGSQFVGASELAQLVADPTYVAAADELAIGLFLTESFAEKERTLFKGLWRLPPAHMLTVSADGLEVKPYWEHEPQEILRYKDENQYAEEFRQLFHDIVSDYLPQRGPIGSFLSGGLDSSSVTCMAREVISQNSDPQPLLESFSLIFPEDNLADESEYIASVTEKGGLTAHLIDPEQNLADLNIESLRPYPVGPAYYPNLTMLNPLMKRAQERGIRVLLTGTGGDDLLMTLRYLSDLFRAGRWLALIQQFQKVRNTYSMSASHLVSQGIIRPLLPQWFRRAVRACVPARFPNWVMRDFSERVGLREEIYAAEVPRKYRELSRQEVYHGFLGAGGTALGCEEEDRYSRPYGIECRNPFLDIRLIEFVLRLPYSELTWDAQTKIVLRKALRGILPEKIRIRQSKGDFTALMDRELQRRQRKKIEPLFTHSTLAKAGIIDAKELKLLWNSYLQEEPCADKETRWTLLTILNIERWYRDNFSEGENSDEQGKRKERVEQDSQKILHASAAH